MTILQIDKPAVKRPNARPPRIGTYDVPRLEVINGDEYWRVRCKCPHYTIIPADMPGAYEWARTAPRRYCPKCEGPDEGCEL